MADQPTPQQIENLAIPPDDSSSPTAADLLGVSAFYGSPNPNRFRGAKATPDQNAQSAMMPVSLARGAVAGTLGFPGDMEAAFRFLVNHYHGDQGEQGPGVSSDTALPTTHDLNKSLPLRTDGGANDFATGVGNLASPIVATGAIKGVSALGKYLAPAFGDALDAAHTAAGGKAFAVREPGDRSAIRQVADEVMPAMSQQIGSAVRDSANLDREIHLVGNDQGSAYRTLGTQSGASPNNAAVDSYAGALGPVYDFHTHPADSVYEGVTPSPTDLRYWQQAYGGRTGRPTSVMIAQPPILAKYGGNDFSLPERLGQASSFSTDRVSRTLDPSRYSDAIQNLKYKLGRSGDVSSALDTDLTKNQTGDILDEFGPLLLQQHYQNQGLGTSRIAMPRTREFGDNFMSGDEVLNALSDPVKSFLKGNGYAVGGSISAPATVGLATFAGQNGGPTGATGTSAGVGAGGQSGDPTGYMMGTTPSGADASLNGSGWSSDMYGTIGGKTNAPTYSATGFNPVTGAMDGTGGGLDPALQDTLTAGHAGAVQNGIQAFLGNWQPYSGEITNNPGEYKITDNRNDPQIQRLAAATGYKGSLDFSDAGTDATNSSGYKGLQDYLKNYYGVAGMSSGWDDSTNPRSSAMTLYERKNDQLVPISSPRSYVTPTSGGYFRQAPGQDLLSALSVIAPAFGGVAGLAEAGAGAAGAGAETASAAGTAAGLGSSYLSGGIGGVVSNLAGQAGSYIGGLTGLGQGASMIGSRLGSYFANQALTNKKS